MTTYTIQAENGIILNENIGWDEAMAYAKNNDLRIVDQYQTTLSKKNILVVKGIR